MNTQKGGAELKQLYSRLFMCTESGIGGSKSSVVFWNEYRVCRLLLCSGVNVCIRKRKLNGHKNVLMIIVHTRLFSCALLL
jgi:hypothetical protein